MSSDPQKGFGPGRTGDSTRGRRKDWPVALPLFPPAIFPEPEIREAPPCEEAPGRVWAILSAGERVQLTSEWKWDRALALYGELKRRVAQDRAPRTFQEDQALRAERRKVLSRLLLPVERGRAALRGGPQVGWLERAYGPERRLLPFPDFLGLNGAWQWHLRGAPLPGLPWKLHPWYAAYFPTRTEHLVLFDRWLAESDLRRVRAAADAGCGAGALTLYLLKRLPREARVDAADLNPAALGGLAEDLRRYGLAERARLHQADFFPKDTGPFDLIAINPPWIPGRPQSAIEAAVYYPPGFFERFFSAAAERLAPEGLLIVLFSTFAREAGVAVENPIEMELDSGGRFVLAEKREAPVAPPRRRLAPWLRRIRGSERVQLWALRKRP